MYVQGLKRRRTENSSVVFVVTSRHHPVVFDEYLSLINKYGLILPITANMAKEMPFVCSLLMMNTFSEDRAHPFLLEEYKRKGVRKGNQHFHWDIMYYASGNDNSQVSNVPMAVLLLIFLLKSNHCAEPGTNSYQELIRFNFNGYEKMFKQGSKFGLSEDAPEENADDFISFYEDYKEIIGLCFAHPFAKHWDDWKYSLDEVIYGLFYADSVPDDWTYTPAKRGVLKPNFCLSESMRKNVDDFLKNHFSLVTDYYEFMSTGFKAGKLYTPPPPPDPEKAKKKEAKKADAEKKKAQAKKGGRKKKDAPKSPPASSPSNDSAGGTDAIDLGQTAEVNETKDEAPKSTVQTVNVQKSLAIVLDYLPTDGNLPTVETTEQRLALATSTPTKTSEAMQTPSTSEQWKYEDDDIADEDDATPGLFPVKYDHLNANVLELQAIVNEKILFRAAFDRAANELKLTEKQKKGGIVMSQEAEDQLMQRAKNHVKGNNWKEMNGSVVKMETNILLKLAHKHVNGVEKYEETNDPSARAWKYYTECRENFTAFHQHLEPIMKFVSQKLPPGSSPGTIQMVDTESILFGSPNINDSSEDERDTKPAAKVPKQKTVNVATTMTTIPRTPTNQQVKDNYARKKSTKSSSPSQSSDDDNDPPPEDIVARIPRKAGRLTRQQQDNEETESEEEEPAESPKVRQESARKSSRSKPPRVPKTTPKKRKAQTQKEIKKSTSKKKKSDKLGDDDVSYGKLRG